MAKVLSINISEKKGTPKTKINPGVLIELRKSNMIYDIVSLINLGVITTSDLKGFSDEIKEGVDFILNRC